MIPTLKTSALQSHVRPEIPISDWITNLCTLMYGEVKTRCEVGGFNCSGYMFWSSDRYDTNANQRRETSDFCRCVAHGRFATGIQQFNDFGAQHFCCVPTPRFKRFWYLTLRCARNVKTAWGSDLNRTSHSYIRFNSIGAHANLLYRPIARRIFWINANKRIHSWFIFVV